MDLIHDSASTKTHKLHISSVQKQAESRCHSIHRQLVFTAALGGALGPRLTSSGPLGPGPLLSSTPVRHLMWTFFTYIHGRGCFLLLRSVAIHEQQAVEHRALFPDTRLAAFSLVLAIPQFYWPTRSSIVIGWEKSASAIRRYERSATREMTATV